MRKTYVLNDEQYKRLMDACRPVPYLIIGGRPPSSPQENANRAWEQLGREMGFKFMTVRPSGNGDREFTAEETEAV